jgi:hypothetical protein
MARFTTGGWDFSKTDGKMASKGVSVWGSCRLYGGLKERGNIAIWDLICAKVRGWTLEVIL